MARNSLFLWAFPSLRHFIPGPIFREGTETERTFLMEGERAWRGGGRIKEGQGETGRQADFFFFLLAQKASERGNTSVPIWLGTMGGKRENRLSKKNSWNNRKAGVRVGDRDCHSNSKSRSWGGWGGGGAEILSQKRAGGDCVKPLEYPIRISDIGLAGIFPTVHTLPHFLAKQSNLFFFLIFVLAEASLSFVCLFVCCCFSRPRGLTFTWWGCYGLCV